MWWIRRDLRLSDNSALDAARSAADQVVPVFILDPALIDSPYGSERRLAFLLDGLRSLDRELRQLGSGLIVRRGRPAEELARLAADTGARAIYVEEDYSGYARRRDADVVAQLPLRFAGGTAVMPPGTVLKADGTPYTVFTPFSNAWLSQVTLRGDDLLPAPERLRFPDGLASTGLPDAPAGYDNSHFPPGEAEALRRLSVFAAESISDYQRQRDRVDLPATSRLSPYLRFGIISPRQAVATAREAIARSRDDDALKGAQTWLNELIWRDFYIHILYHFPSVLHESFRPDLRDIAWRNDPAEFDAWRLGQTGYPIVDAAMRQLSQTGWMHNRARMIVASFLVKDLLIDWRWGERWFMQQLLDGDPAANSGGWQWTAGTGTDAAPYFRVFNPTTQARKFDPDGRYIRHWVPELRQVAGSHIHAPWEMPAALQDAAGCVIGRDYPAPIVDHTQARERALAAYAAARESA